MLHQFGQAPLFLNDSLFGQHVLLLQFLNIFDHFAFFIFLVVLLAAEHLFALAFFKHTDCVQYIERVVNASSQVLFLVCLLLLAYGPRTGCVERVIFVEVRNDVSNFFVSCYAFVNDSLHYIFRNLFQTWILFVVVRCLGRRVAFVKKWRALFILCHIESRLFNCQLLVKLLRYEFSMWRDMLLRRIVRRVWLARRDKLLFNLESSRRWWRMLLPKIRRLPLYQLFSGKHCNRRWLGIRAKMSWADLLDNRRRVGLSVLEQLDGFDFVLFVPGKRSAFLIWQNSVGFPQVVDLALSCTKLVFAILLRVGNKLNLGSFAARVDRRHAGQLMDRYFMGFVLAELQLDQAAHWGLLVVHIPFRRTLLGQDWRVAYFIIACKFFANITRWHH